MVSIVQTNLKFSSLDQKSWEPQKAWRKQGRLPTTQQSPKSLLYPHGSWKRLEGAPRPRRGFLCKVRSGARKTSGPQSPHRVPGTQESHQWLGSGETGPQNHHQPVGVCLQGYAVPQPLPGASPRQLLNETAPDQSSKFWGVGVERGVKKLSFLFQAPQA